MQTSSLVDYRNANSWATLRPSAMEYLGMEFRDFIKCFRWCLWCYNVRSRYRRIAGIQVSFWSVPRWHQMFLSLKHTSGFTVLLMFVLMMLPLLTTTYSIHSRLLPQPTLVSFRAFLFTVHRMSSLRSLISHLCTLYALSSVSKHFLQGNTRNVKAPEPQVLTTVFCTCLLIASP